VQPQQENNPQPPPADPQPPVEDRGELAQPRAPLHLVVQPEMSAHPPMQPAAAPPPRPGKKPTVDELREALKEVYDPEIPINVVDLGLLYKLEEHDGIVDIDLTLTSPHCPIGDQIAEQVRETVRTLPGISAVNVKLVFEPLWSKDMITADGRLQASMLGLM
jgi:metal-sulfur cluster biosynthetic enzyme